MARGQLFLYAILYHPSPTKEQHDRGETPKTEIVIEPDHLLAGNIEQARTLVGRLIPEKYLDKLEDLEVIVGPLVA
jgi:hypothetical protein